MRHTGTVLAIGASGEFAGLVVPELARRGRTVRGFVRDAALGDGVRRHGAAEIAVGDLQDRESLDAALNGVESVFYIAPAFMPDEAEVGVGMVEAARRAGVRRFVFSSVIHPTIAALVNHRDKAPVEDAALNSGMEYVFLQPAMFFQNYARGWPDVSATGTLAEPWSSASRFTRVDYRDVAEVAAIALTEDRLAYGTFELCAEGNLDRHDVAAMMGDVLGREIRAARLDRQPSVEGAAGSPEAKRAAAMGAMAAWYDRHDLLGNPLILRTILGREPRTLRAFFEELAGRAGNTHDG